MQHQNSLLIRRFDWHKSHRGSLHGFGDRLGVGGVVLLALDIGLYELQRHQADIVPKRGDFSSPIVCRVAGLNPNQRRVQSGKERQHLRASELSFENDLSRIVDVMNLKDVLGQVQSDYCYFQN